MKKVLKIILVVILIAGAGGYIYWQYNKRQIIKDAVKDAIAKKTDSLYFLQYDSSLIDEVNGNVSFYNVVLQSDSTQKQLLNSSDSLPNVLYNISIKKIAATGIDVAGLLQQSNVTAKKIILHEPKIYIINTGADKPKPFTRQDTLALYEKMLGKLKCIKADTIQVSNGMLLITDKTGKPQTTLEHINISLRNFLIDSTRDYQSIISYFVKDVQVKVDNIQLPAGKTNTSINIENLEYNAAARSLSIAAIRQYNPGNTTPITNLKNIQISRVNTDAFILQERIKAGEITCDGGQITIYTNVKPGSGNNNSQQSIDLSADVIDQVQVAGISLGSTKIIIINRRNPNAAPIVLNNAKFKVITPVKITEETSINNLINNAQWELSANGFAFNTKNNMYAIETGNFIINNKDASVKIKSFNIRPLLTEQQFVKKVNKQMDQYNLSISNVTLSGVNFSKLLSQKVLEINEAVMQPNIKIFHDKTLPGDGSNKVGNYPHQLIQKMKLPLHVKRVRFVDGSVSYRERAEKSGLIGNVLFTKLTATITNISNTSERIKQSPLMVIQADAKFLEEGLLTSTWQLPMNTNSGDFTIKGELKSMNALTLNPLIEPLAMASIKSGNVQKVAFDITGSNTVANANILFLYRNLKIEVLKKDDDVLKKKGLISALANTLIKNEQTNPSNIKKVVYQRDVTRSFFNLVWKTIFTGVKNTAIGVGKKSE